MDEKSKEQQTLDRSVNFLKHILEGVDRDTRTGWGIDLYNRFLVLCFKSLNEAKAYQSGVPLLTFVGYVYKGLIPPSILTEYSEIKSFEQEIFNCLCDKLNLIVSLVAEQRRSEQKEKKNKKGGNDNDIHTSESNTTD